MGPRSMRDIPLSSILCPPQVRTHFDQNSIQDLARSIERVGLQQPVRVMPHGQEFELLDGERRVRAVRLLGWATIPALVEEGERSESDVIVQALVANCHRDDLSAIDLARAIDRLMKEGKLSATQVSEKLAMSQARVSKLIALLVLPKEVQEKVHTGGVAPSTAYEIAKTRDPKERGQLIQEALKGRLTRETASQRSRRTKKKAPSKKKQPRGRRGSAVRIALGTDCSATFSGPGLTPRMLVTWLEGLVARARECGVIDADLASFAKALSAEGEP